MSETDAGNRPGGGTDGDPFRGIIRDVVAELPGVVYRCRNDPGWTILAITPNVERLTGYAAEEFLVGEDLAYVDLIHPSDRDRVWEEVQEGLERDELFRIIYRIYTRSGEERWVLEEGRMGPAREGEGGGVLTGYIQDVTHSLKGQLEPLGAELERTRRQARQLELLQTVTAIVNEKQSLEAALRAALPEICRSLDFEVGHIVWIEGEEGDALVSSAIWHDSGDGGFDSFREATDRGSRDPRGDLAGRVLASGEPQWTQDVKADPGFPRVSPSSRDPIRSGVAVPVLSGRKSLAVVELFSVEPRRRDPETERLLSQIGIQLGRVWERERATEERRSAQRRLQQLADHIGAVFWMSTPSGAPLYVSRGIEEIIGWDPGGTPANEFLDIIHPADRPWVTELFSDPERAPYDIEYRVLRPDGDIRWIREKAFPIENETGEVYRVGGLAEDVTEKHRAREALKETSRLLEMTVSSIEEAVLVVGAHDGESRIVEANPAAERIFGWTRGELVGGNTAKLYVDRTSYERFEEESGRTLADGKAFRAGFAMRRKGGDAFEAEQTVTLLDSREGLEGGAVVVVRDVSERKEAERRRRASEERFRQIAERIEDVFWITTPGKGLEYVSPAYQHIWGRSPEELYNDATGWIDHIHPDDRQRVIEALPDQVEGSYEQEYRIVRPDGETRWIWDRAFPVRDADGEVHRIVGVAEDITERVRAQRELHDRERRYRAYVENASDLLSTLDRDGRMMYQSPPLKRLLGYDPEELRGRSVFELIHPDEREDAMSAWKELVEEDGATLELPAFRFRHEDGSWRIWEATLTNLLSDPAVGAVLSNARDVTERLEMEEKMRQSQRLEAIGRLAGGVAHDFNNLLTVIRSQTDLLLLELEDSDPTASELEVIQSAADRAATLTNQLLAFSRDQVLRPRVVILCDVVRGTVGLVERVIGEDVRIETDLPGDRPPVEIDPSQLEQVVLNLAVNARDAMPDGGTLRLRTFFEEVDERTAREHGDIHPGAYTVLQVSDTGVGMDEETRSRAFEPFYTTKAGKGGTGLGLAMAYGFVKQSGGAIHVESAPGEGATFYLRFPVVEREPEAVESSEVPNVLVERSHGTVLVVEDDASVRRVVAKILERSGLDIVQAEDAETGLEILEGSRTIDLILTDLVLPGLSGRALAARLRETYPDIPVIVMSGYAAEAPDHTGDLPAEIPFIQKPFTPGILVQTLRRSLSGGGTAGP